MAFIIPGGTITSLYNRQVHWERSEQVDAGLDLTVLSNRLTLEFDFYNRRTKDMLVSVDVPGAVGLSPVETNVGAVTNRGVDFTLNWQHTVRELSYSVRFTGTTIITGLANSEVCGFPKEISGAVV